MFISVAKLAGILLSHHHHLSCLYSLLHSFRQQNKIVEYICYDQILKLMSNFMQKQRGSSICLNQHCHFQNQFTSNDLKQSPTCSYTSISFTYDRSVEMQLLWMQSQHNCRGQSWRNTHKPDHESGIHPHFNCIVIDCSSLFCWDRCCTGPLGWWLVPCKKVILHQQSHSNIHTHSPPVITSLLKTWFSFLNVDSFQSFTFTSVCIVALIPHLYFFKFYGTVK